MSERKPVGYVSRGMADADPLVVDPGSARVDVLLAHSLFMALDPKQVQKNRPYPPLATLYAASVLREAGWSVGVFDAMLASGPEAFELALRRARPRAVVLFEDSFNFLSKMCLGSMRRAALRMVAASRALQLPVLVAGSDASDAPEVYLAGTLGASAVLLGEAEHTLLEVVEILLGASPEADLRAVPGLALRGEPGESAAVWRSAARVPERVPDRFPLPARDLVDLAAYRRRWRAAHGRFSLNMASTRGCPFHCNWCAKPIWGQRYAMRSPAAVAEEMRLLKDAYGAEHVWFTDDIFGLRPDWTAEFGAAVEALGAALPFQIQTRVDLVTEAAAEGLARAGCEEVWLGVESGSQRILDAMDKGLDLNRVAPAVAALRGRGMRIGFFLQFGYPGETWADIQATVEMVRQQLPDRIGVSVSYPLPGTRFHDRVAAQLQAKRHWSDSEDLAMLFEGSYRSPFYRQLHRALHQELDALLADRSDAEVGAPAWRWRWEGHPSDAGERARALRARADEAWAALAVLEATERNAAPTLLPAEPQAPAPDLSRPAN